MHEKTIVAKAFILNPEGLILALHRSKTVLLRPLTWDLPGGGVDFGEDPTDAVLREIKEETGLDIQNPQVFITKTSNDKKYVVRLLYYAYTNSETIRLSAEHDRYKWVTKAGLQKQDIPNHYKDCLAHLPK